ncbi:hypothetical protein [Microtetraspora malaysiensis]|uniref:hypothetical protein n=1 Tax=Microtetraspora malaysiensis TaxID=161358 RepID=UPI000832DCC6|nr:hypothetical protein [Microtetraspora malaysiensis]
MLRSRGDLAMVDLRVRRLREARRALGVSDRVEVGDEVRLPPAGLTPIEGVVDYATPVFLGVRSADALYRFYGRDAWG